VNPANSLQAILLLWLAGNALRLTILAVPPVLALIQADLNLSGTEIGILTGLPVVLLALASLPGSVLIARYGALATLIVGTLLTALGGALRGLAPDVFFLYGATILMGAGVAVMQTSMPSLVRQWMPKRIVFGSAVYTNGLLVGEILPVAFTLSFVMPLLGDGWRAGLAFWSVPTLAIAIILYFFAPRPPAPDKAAPMPQWWPDWSDTLMWRLGLMLGGANTLYFGTNAFLPGYLTYAGRPDLIAPALTALNLGQIPVSLLLLAFARRTERRVWPFVTFGVLMFGAIGGVVATASVWTVVFAGIVGFSAAGVLALSLALPATLAAPPDVGRMAAAMFTIGYAVAVILAVTGGALWDLTADARFAFLPIAVGALPLLVLSPTIRARLAA
jgi:CP family cyanate transporter-like MFS transporter